MKITQHLPPPLPVQPNTGLDHGPAGSQAGQTISVEEKPPPGRALVPVRPRQPPIVQGSRVDTLVDQAGGKEIRASALNIRQISPRKIMETGYELYTIGAIGWDEYEMLAFQPELHPDYNKTIGALVGDTAQPDRSLDFIEIWEKRLVYERRYNPDNTRKIRQTEHLISILRQIDSPTNLVA